jgi:hypothetical protein
MNIKCTRRKIFETKIRTDYRTDMLKSKDKGEGSSNKRDNSQIACKQYPQDTTTDKLVINVCLKHRTSFDF